MDTKRTRLLGKNISLIWTRPQNHAELLTATENSNRGVSGMLKSETPLFLHWIGKEVRLDRYFIAY